MDTTMKLPIASSHDARQLFRMLEEILHKEQEQWKLYNRNNFEQANMVTAGQRRETVRWFFQLNNHFGFYPETFFLSTTMLDKVLHSVKVRPRFLKCIGITCFSLAAKTLEEDEVVPSTLQFVQQSGCGCSVAEILRMERRVLDILGWNLRLITPLDFLHILHASLLSSVPNLLSGLVHMTPGRQLSQLTRNLQAMLMNNNSLQFAPSVLALAVITTELQQFLPQWFTVTHIMQIHVQVSDEELIRCMDLVSLILSPCQLTTNSRVTKCKKRHRDESSAKKRRRAEPDDDDVYEAIKWLYHEEQSDAVSAVTMVTCSGEHRQDEVPAVMVASLAVAN
ncbi:hypothetical protein LSH36_12g08058 [Paralvinella palmiformis]|uniref:Cyclin-like domain-containing protein n=1 Tax=Paralvinella palmiformis TaxID=53620 RepID=A0AAD9NI15_9ANNE|nr:hypothetical protein LSH36_12g08058 [Paralvinella palmiformis]